MTDLSYNQKLDLIIKKMQIATSKYGRLEWQVFADVMRKDMYQNDLRDLLEELVIHGSVKRDNSTKDWYWLTPLGEHIADTGIGFEAKEKEEALLVANSIESLNFSKKSHHINKTTLRVAILTLVAAIISILVTWYKH